MVSVNVHCPHCQSAQVYRHVQDPKDRDIFCCRGCHRVFLLTYTSEATHEEHEPARQNSRQSE